LRRSSPANRPSLLIAAVSGRALAQAAFRSGFTPLVVDFFADLDTQEAAHSCRKLSGVARGFQWAPLARALEALAAESPSPILGLVYGSGFEDRPHLLACIAKKWTLLGNDRTTVQRLKDPDRFFTTLDRLGVVHPATSYARPTNGGDAWLVKRKGAAGGSHIGASEEKRRRGQLYYQERVDGRAVSALFVANGSEARVLGFSDQWTAPTKRSRFRYGGAVRPARLATAAKEAMVSVAERLAPEFAIKGLASADFIVDGQDVLLLEINPRPGATVDIFDSEVAPLLRLHMSAVRQGRLPGRALRLDGAMASAVVFAPRRIQVPFTMQWPDWAADKPESGEIIDKNRPICTVWARAATGARAKSLVEERTRQVLVCIESKRRGDNREQNGPKGGRARDLSRSAAERQHQGRAGRQIHHR
jgi:predicted ATP-grasp superfamily ATP-dependent carboligase